MVNRTYSQYADKPKTVQWLKITSEMAKELSDVYQLIRTSYDINTDNNALLDIIGEIVGVNRNFEFSIVYDTDTMFGDLSEKSIFGGDGSQFNSNTSNNVINNLIFRMLIKSKICKNNNDVTLDGIVDSLRFIMNVENVRIVDDEDMTFTIHFGSTLTELERFVIRNFNIVPKPQGVKFDGFVEDDTVTVFGGNNEISQFGGYSAQFGWKY